MNNAFRESLKQQRVRQECLNQNWFLSLADAQDKTEAWREYHNSYRPLRTLGYKTPEEFAVLHEKI